MLTLGRAAERFPDDVGTYTTLGRVWLEDAERRYDRVALKKAIEGRDAGLMRRGKAIGDTSQQLDRPAPSVFALRPLPACSAIDELCDEILPALDLARVVHCEECAGD